MDVIKFRVIRENSKMPFRILMAQMLKRLESVPVGDAKETRKQNEEHLFWFLQNLPVGIFRVNNAGIKHVLPNADPDDKRNMWWKNCVPAWFKRDSEVAGILKTIQGESPENLQ